MNKGMFCRISLCLTVVGIVAVLLALGSVGFDINALEAAETETVETFGDISLIEIDDEFANVEIYPSESLKSYMVYPVREGIEREIVCDSVIRVKASDQRKWYQRFGVNLYNDTIKIYIGKETDCRNVEITAVNGNVTVAEGLTFHKVTIENVNGDVSFFSQIEDEIYLKSVNGDVTLCGLKGGTPTVFSENGDVTVKDLTLEPKLLYYDENGSPVETSCNLSAVCHNGRMKLEDIKAKQISVYCKNGSVDGKNINGRGCAFESENGSITLEAVSTEMDISVVTTNGNIKAYKIDSERDIYFTTVNGNVDATVTRNKIYEVESLNGKTSVPESAVEEIAGIQWNRYCKVTTVNGDVKIEKVG